MSESVTSFTTEDFFDLLARSGLLNDTLFEAQKSRFLKEGLAPKAVLGKMLNEHLVTTFQAKQLSERRHRGFFLSEKYKILDFLGQGGMSRVLLCEHLLLQRLVAVKILNKSLDKFPGAAERFLREARASASMDHPNIARVFDVDRTGIGPCIVMEYVDGTNLHEMAVKRELLGINRVAHFIRQAAIGLQQAHQAGLVHRDIKPANLMLDRTGTIKLLDLGLARFFDPTRSDNLTQQIDASCIIGTADYISPEQVMDSSSADIRSDIYSLGYSMYFLLTRKLPAGDGPVMRKLLWHQTKDPESICSVRPEIPERLGKVLERMIRKNPGERYQTPADVVEALEPWTSEPIEIPTNEEMPKTRANEFRLGLCPPPDSSKVVGASSSNSSSKDSSPSSSNAGSSAVRQESETKSENPPASHSGSTIGYSIPLGSQAIMPIGSTIRSARTNEVMSSSTETVSTSGSSYIRGLAETAKGNLQGAPLRRNSLTLLLIILAFGIGGLVAQWRLGYQPGVVTTMKTGMPTGKPADSRRNPDLNSTKRPGSNIVPVVPTGIVLRGGGSTFIRPAMEQWARMYEAQAGVKIEYSAVGSSRGVEGLISNFLDFGCSDSMLSENQISEAGSDVLHIPLAMGAVVPIYNIVGTDGEAIPLRFTGAVLASIYSGKIKTWNDPAIAVSNPGNDLPDLEITVVYRKDGSGTSAIWTEYLSKSSSSWKNQFGSGNKVSWPVGIGVEKNDGVADAVSRTVGAIGYVELSYAIANGLSIGHVKNQSGAYVEATTEGIASTVASFRDVPDDFRYSLIDLPGTGSYPIIGTCWAVVRVNQTGDRGTELVKFLRWAVSSGQEQLPGLHFGQLPSHLSDRINSALDKVIITK